MHFEYHGDCPDRWMHFKDHGDFQACAIQDGACCSPKDASDQSATLRQMLESITTARGRVQKQERQCAPSGRTATEGMPRYPTRCNSLATNSITPTPEQSCWLSLDPASPASQAQGWLEQDFALSGRRNSCPTIPDGGDSGKADTGRASAETPRLVARFVASSTPSGSRRPQPGGIVRTGARHRPSHILMPATGNLLLDSTEAAEQHRREREVAPPSSVTDPSRPGSGSKVQRGGTPAASQHGHRPRDVSLSALKHMSAGEDLMQDDLNRPLSPTVLRLCSPLDCRTPRGRQSEQRRERMMAASGLERARHASHWRDLYQDQQRHHVCRGGRSPAGTR